MNIPEEILTEIYRHARAEFPNECCGWLTGPKDIVTRVRRAINAYDPLTHPTAPDRTAESAYVMDINDSLELDRSFDSPASYVAYQFPATPIVVRPQRELPTPRVIYHSHPNGRAYFSETDRKVATDPWSGDGPAYPVKQLVVGIDANRVVEARLFEWDDSAKGFEPVAEFAGAEI